MKRILHIIKQQVTPVRDSTIGFSELGIDMIWWKQFPKESRMLFEFKEPSDIEYFTLHSDKPFGGSFFYFPFTFRKIGVFLKYH